MSNIVNKLWGFCHTLRHDGIDYGDYIEQITYLLFIKMSNEKGIDLSKTKFKNEKGKEISIDCSWPTLAKESGTPLKEHYIDILRALGRQPKILGDIFSGSQSRFENPVNLSKLINLIDEIDWTSLDVDVKGDAFEGLLEKAASEGKKGAGQYFTPRLLIQAIVRCMKPDPRNYDQFKICDPACGSGGFLVCAYEWLMLQTKDGALERKVANRIKSKTYYGQDLVPRPRRLALMNLFLHGLEPQIGLGDTIDEVPKNTNYFDVVLTNPPFGTKGANQVPTREDFTIATSNKQLNFIQHVMTILKPGGRAAVVVPDNCLFADQAGDIFKILTEDCDLHTVLRLPNGTFTPYSPGTKTNVIFFTKGFPTENTWIYDGRTNIPHITKKDRPLSKDHFKEFELCFGKDPNGKSKRKKNDSNSDRWKKFPISKVKEVEFKIDSLKWIQEESTENGNADLEPEEIITDIISEIEIISHDLKEMLITLENGK